MTTMQTYCANAHFLSNVSGFVYIDLVEFDIPVCTLRKFLENRRDDSAGATPSSPEIKDGKFATVYLKISYEG